MPLYQLKGKKNKGEDANDFKTCSKFSLFKTKKKKKKEKVLRNSLFLILSAESKIWLRSINSEIGFVKQSWYLLPIKLQNN